MEQKIGADVMKNMKTGAEDLRITKTKKKLFDTFIGMLGTMPIEDITVNE